MSPWRNLRASCFDQLCELLNYEIWVAIVRILRWRVPRLDGQRYLGKQADGITQHGLECSESAANISNHFRANSSPAEGCACAGSDLSPIGICSIGGLVRGTENSKSRRETLLLPTVRPKITTRLSKLTWTEAREGSALSTSNARKPRLDGRQFARLSTKTMPRMPSYFSPRTATSCTCWRSSCGPPASKLASR